MTEAPNGVGVQGVGAVTEVDQVRQWHRLVRGNQRHVPVRAKAKHLAPRVASGDTEVQQTGTFGTPTAPAQAQMPYDKPGDGLGIALSLGHMFRGEGDAVDVAPLVTDDERCFRHQVWVKRA